MSEIPTFLSLSPLTPVVNNYDPVNPDAPCAEGRLYSYGGFAGHYGQYKLRTQYANNEVMIGYDAVLPGQAVVNGDDHPWRHCTVHVKLYMQNIPAGKQLVFLYGLRPVVGIPEVQFIFGGEVYETLDLIRGDDKLVTVIVCPEGEFDVDIMIRLASKTRWSCLVAFRGVDIFLA